MASISRTRDSTGHEVHRGAGLVGLSAGASVQAHGDAPGATDAVVDPIASREAALAAVRMSGRRRRRLADTPARPASTAAASGSSASVTNSAIAPWLDASTCWAISTGSNGSLPTTASMTVRASVASVLDQLDEPFEAHGLRRGRCRVLAVDDERDRGCCDHACRKVGRFSTSEVGERDHVARGQCRDHVRLGLLDRPPCRKRSRRSSDESHPGGAALGHGRHHRHRHAVGCLPDAEVGHDRGE